MAERVEKVTRTVPAETTEPAPAVAPTETREVSERSVGGSTLAQRVIWYIAGVLLVLLAFRFVLTLLGANPNNAFASFIYDTSHPLVAPFFSLFGYNLQYGVSRFETFTVVAIAVYTVVAYGLAKLMTLNQPEPR